MGITEAVRRWSPVLSRLRTHLHSAALTPHGAEICTEAFSVSELLLQELSACQAENADLRQTIRDLTNEWNALFDAMPIACVVTDAVGNVRLANRSASELLNTSAKHLSTRMLLHFVQERQVFSDLLRTVSRAENGRAARFVIRPRERAPREVDVFLVPSPGDTSDWLWFLSPAAEKEMVALRATVARR